MVIDCEILLLFFGFYSFVVIKIEIFNENIFEYEIFILVDEENIEILF